MELSMGRIYKKKFVLFIFFIFSNFAFAQRSNNVGFELDKPANDVNEANNDTTLLQDILIEVELGKTAYIGSYREDQNAFPELFSFGTGIAYQGSPYVELGAFFSYHHLIYDESYDSNTELMIPYQFVTVKPDGPGHIYEASAKIRIFFSASKITQPYLFFQGGNFWTFIPGRTSTTSENGVIGNTYYYSSSKESTSFYGGGFGLKVHINRSIALGVEINGSYGNHLYGQVLIIGLKLVSYFKI